MNPKSQALKQTITLTKKPTPPKKTIVLQQKPQPQARSVDIRTIA